MEELKIKRKHFTEVLLMYFDDIDKDYANDIFDEMVEKKDSPGDDAANFIKTYFYHRKRVLNHRGIKMPKVGTSAHTTLQNIVPHLVNYSEEWDLGINEVFNKFLEIGSRMIARLSPQSLSAKTEQILDEYNLIMEIEDDPNKDTTNILVNLYSALLVESGAMGFDSTTHDLIHFKEASAYVVKNKLDPTTYMDLMFERLKVFSTTPLPSQLTTPKALQYVSTNYNSTGTVNKGRVVSLKKIKDMKYDND